MPTTTAPLHIAVIGTGNIGRTLGGAFARAGHSVVFGSRSPQPATETAGGGPEVRDIAGAVEASDVVVLALPGGAVAEFARAHSDALAGKVIVDAANSIGGSGPAHHHAEIRDAVPTARYGRAFNTLGWENFASPRFGDTVGDLFYASDESARPVVEALISAVGLRPIFVGEGQEDVVDGVLRLWFALAIGQQRGRTLAFRVLDAGDAGDQQQVRLP